MTGEGATGPITGDTGVMPPGEPAWVAVTTVVRVVVGSVPVDGDRGTVSPANRWWAAAYRGCAVSSLTRLAPQPWRLAYPGRCCLAACEEGVKIPIPLN